MNTEALPGVGQLPFYAWDVWQTQRGARMQLCVMLIDNAHGFDMIASRRNASLL